jgi:hypothetical protein
MYIKKVVLVLLVVLTIATSMGLCLGVENDSTQNDYSTSTEYVGNKKVINKVLELDKLMSDLVIYSDKNKDDESLDKDDDSKNNDDIKNPKPLDSILMQYDDYKTSWEYINNKTEKSNILDDISKMNTLYTEAYSFYKDHQKDIENSLKDTEVSAVLTSKGVVNDSITNPEKSVENSVSGFSLPVLILLLSSVIAILLSAFIIAFISMLKKRTLSRIEKGVENASEQSKSIIKKIDDNMWEQRRNSKEIEKLISSLAEDMVTYNRQVVTGRSNSGHGFGCTNNALNHTNNTTNKPWNQEIINPYQEYIDAYNAVLKDEIGQQVFCNKYKPQKFGIDSNRLRQNPEAVVEYSTLFDGDFYLIVKRDIKGLDEALVFLKFNMTLVENNLIYGGIKDAFDTNKSSNEYRNIKSNKYSVIKPAVFIKKPNNIWELKSKGEIRID